MIHTPKFPLKFGDRASWEQVEEVKQLVFFHMKNLILTSPGERISDADYGVGMRRFLFEPITVGTLNNIAKTIDIALQRYLSYIDVEDISVTSPPESNSINVKIFFTVPDLDISEVLDLSVSGVQNY